LAALSLLSVVVGSVFGQDPFEAIPKEQVPQYHFNFAKNYFPTPEAEKADRANLYASVAELEDLKGHVRDSTANLLRALKLRDQITLQWVRHDAYLYLRYATNIKDSASETDEGKLTAEVTKRTGFVDRSYYRSTIVSLLISSRKSPR